MSLFKCKMCGGTLEIKNETVAVCEYCGTQQTLPKLNDERRANLYDRANHFRRSNEFDKAIGMYERILNEDTTDAEAYWSLVLCRFGIEYVEDPATHKRIPTVNRAQYTSIFDDDNYKAALEYADGYQRHIYQEEAKAINEIQKGILAISQKEEPFDVFICYKETDRNGRRTPDSVLANDLYHQLTQEGFKVFFSRITLEDKLGVAYEPYIFAALNSAKVMVVVGTKPEYFNAVWVKNEWSRYLSLIRGGAKKVLIPAYRDMDPYDLPEEFSHLQAQDMGKLGFMQDLIRGIKKLAHTEQPKQTAAKETVITTSNSGTAPLLKRTFMFLEDGDWNSANEYCERVLDIDPECASAYLGKLMAELHVCRQEDLNNCAQPFDSMNSYQKVLRFGDEKLCAVLKGYIDQINERNEHERLEGIYRRANNTMSTANTESSYKEAARLYESIAEYNDSAALAQECYENAEIKRKDAILAFGKSKMTGEFVALYEDAIIAFKSIPGWKDADEKAYACKQKIEILKAKEEADRLEYERKAEIARKEAERIAKRDKKIFMIVTPIICAVIVFVIILGTIIIPNGKYNDAVALMKAGQYDDAIAAFSKLGDYKDAPQMVIESEGRKKQYELETAYQEAVNLLETGSYIEAYEVFTKLNGYKDSNEKANTIYTEHEDEKIKFAKVGDYVSFGAYEQDNNTSNGKEAIEWLILEVKDRKALVISKYALDYMKYEPTAQKYKSVTWETCTLREWLNNDFIDIAFSDYEKAAIPTVMVSADRNSHYSTNPGTSTKDQIFLLSLTEANEFFESDSARQCVATEYAVANGARENDKTGNFSWWLRSPGSESHFTAYVKHNGEINYHGTPAFHQISVRPALWIDLSAL